MATHHLHRVKYLIIPALLFFVALPAMAACDPAKELCNPIQANTFAELVKSLASFVVTIAIPFIVIFLIYSGFLFVKARGNETELKKAKETFYWTIIGAAVVVGAYALASAVVHFACSLGGSGTNCPP